MNLINYMYFHDLNTHSKPNHSNIQVPSLLLHKKATMIHKDTFVQWNLSFTTTELYDHPSFVTSLKDQYSPRIIMNLCNFYDHLSLTTKVTGTENTSRS